VLFAAERNVEQAQYLARRVEAEPTLELVTPVTLNVVCFRFCGTQQRIPPDGELCHDSDEEDCSYRTCRDINSINTEILLRLQERGIAVPSSTILNGKFCIRACFTNHRTRQEDIDMLCDSVKALGKEIIAESAENERQGADSAEHQGR
jgi:glutamate/tyrosine decarboxylase-like PLP-dependent enzyme